nr:histidine phosphatase family protein [Lachnospiraceae bacterium]
MKLYIMRHGETNWNKEKRLQGRSDIDINENGILLAEKTSKALEDVPFTHIFSSPLTRAYHTATIIKGNRNLDIVKDERLLEISFGNQEGL